MTNRGFSHETIHSHSSIRFCAGMRRSVPRRERVLLCKTSTQLKVGCENMVAEARGKFVLRKQYGIYVPILHFKNWVDVVSRDKSQACVIIITRSKPAPVGKHSFGFSGIMNQISVLNPHFQCLDASLVFSRTLNNLCRRRRRGCRAGNCRRAALFEAFARFFSRHSQSPLFHLQTFWNIFLPPWEYASESKRSS